VIQIDRYRLALPPGTGHLSCPVSTLSDKESSTNFYRRFPGDYLRDTQHLTLSQHGIYCLLLDTLYATEKPIKDRQDAYRICRCVDTQLVSECDKIITEFFVENKRGITHKKVNEEIENAQSRLNAARTNGLRGGRPKTQEKPSGFSKPNPHESSPDSRLQTPYKEESKPKPKGVEIPDAPIWMPAETWMAYIEMRREKKAKITPKAALIIFKKLAAWMELGMDPREVLEQSIMNGWTGIFELKKNSGGKNERLTAEEAFRRNVETFKKHNLEKFN